MEENFHPDYIKMTKFHDQFLPVPVGAKSDEKAPIEILMDIKIAFPQKQKVPVCFPVQLWHWSIVKENKKLQNLSRGQIK